MREAKKTEKIKERGGREEEILKGKIKDLAQCDLSMNKDEIRTH